MRWSRLFVPTLREDPAGAATPGHRWLVRAGYLREAAPAEYHCLALARLALRRIVGAVRRELDASGAQEVLLASAGDFAQAVAAVARGELRSYKQLPQSWYQFDTRVRDEPRPGLGLPGARKQFVTEVCAMAGSADECRIEEMLRRAVERANLEAIPVDAPGRVRSLLVLNEAGEQRVAVAGDRVEHWELAQAAGQPPSIADPEGDLPPEPFHTPGQKTIADVAGFTGLPESSQMKSLVMAADGAVVLALVRGDHAVSEAKMARVLGATSLRPATDSEMQQAFGAGAGSLGPVRLRGVRIVADCALEGRRNMICGANRDDYHLRHVTPGRDFQAEFHDIRQVAAADGVAPRGAIEVALIHPPAAAPGGLRVLDPNGKETTPWTARATLYLERILGAAAELFHDEAGLALPPALAPFDVIVTPVNYKDAALQQAANQVYADCRSHALETLLDDRDERPGVKFKDADLIGVPYRITAGKKVSEGKVEVTDRRARSTTEAPVEQAAASIRRQLDGN